MSHRTWSLKHLQDLMSWQRAKIADRFIKMPSAKCTVSNSTQKFAIQNTATTYCVTLPFLSMRRVIGQWTTSSIWKSQKSANKWARQKSLAWSFRRVDSSVVGVLLQKAIGDQLTCIFVDHGLLRKGEAEQVMESLGGKFGLNIIKVDAKERFLSKLAGFLILKKTQDHR